MLRRKNHKNNGMNKKIGQINLIFKLLYKAADVFKGNWPFVALKSLLPISIAAVLWRSP